MGYVYLIKSELEPIFKIGITKNSPERRLKTLQTGNSEKLLLIEYHQSDAYRKVETQLHRLLKDYRLEGEWFHLTDDFDFKGYCLQAENIIKALKNNPFY